ncbi:uncharacterized protein LOC143920160 [Arctopsyche grandis]|uniref:uncharacterized protein LOC143920160 n=1 Tax=Arctopsyche grandis TaxID=121162 RepID=UPI00406D808C
MILLCLGGGNFNFFTLKTRQKASRHFICETFIQYYNTQQKTEPYDVFQESESTTIRSALETTADIPASENSVQNTTRKFKPVFFPRRSSNKFTLSSTSTTTPAPKDESHRFSSSSSGIQRRRPVVERRRITTPSSSGGSNSTEAEATTRASVRPTRLFVRKYTGLRSSGGGVTGTTTSTTSTTTKPLDSSSRKNFRIGLRRRRPALNGTTIAAVSSTASSALVSDTPTTIGSNHDQESHSTIHQEKDNKNTNKRKSVKIQKRPLTNLIKPNEIIKSSEYEDESLLNQKGSFEENQNGEKIYSSVIKEDHTLVQQKKAFDTSKNEVKNEEFETDVTADVAVAAHQLLSAPLPTIPSYASGGESDTVHSVDYQFTRAYLLASSVSPIINSNDYVSPSTRPSRLKYTPSGVKSRRISTTVSPQITHLPIVRRKPQHHHTEEFAKINPVTKHYRTVVDYEYYDDDDIRVIGRTPNQEKVVIHNSGVIQCLDQGNFPHPDSCKKFISCARMENSEVYGWEYTCPKGLSFDPVGGICNWSAGLGCKD